ncbi:MAG: MFS transporter [Prevotellaceae bacterium]|nr:MFS transporter [Prevotellaceae bacterium]
MSSFIRTCLAYTLLFLSQYMLMPVIPTFLSERLEVVAPSSGSVYLYLTLGMLIIGGFQAYLLDAFRRKSVAFFSILGLALLSVAYMFVNREIELYIFPFVQGILFALANVSITTISIDVLPTDERDCGNKWMGVATFTGMFIGLVAGHSCYRWLADTQWFFAIVIGALLLAAIFILSVPVAFRAPIGLSVFSTDRFILPRSWVPALNLLLLGLPMGILLFRPESESFLLPLFGQSMTLTLPILVGAGGLVGLLIYRIYPDSLKEYRRALIGLLITMHASFLLLVHNEWTACISVAVMGIGWGMSLPATLRMFVNLSRHCQRVSANTTFVLAWQTALAVGIWTSGYLREHAFPLHTFHLGMLALIAAVLWFLFISVPYYKRSLYD